MQEHLYNLHFSHTLSQFQKCICTHIGLSIPIFAPPAPPKKIYEYIVKLSFLDAGASLQPVSLLTPFLSSKIAFVRVACLFALPTYIYISSVPN